MENDLATIQELHRRIEKEKKRGREGEATRGILIEFHINFRREGGGSILLRNTLFHCYPTCHLGKKKKERYTVLRRLFSRNTNYITA